MIYQERWGILFFKKLANGKYRYYEKFYDESEEKWKQASVTLTSKTRQAQGHAKLLLDKKIKTKLLENSEKFQQKQVNLDITLKEVYEEYQLFRKQELKDSSFVKQRDILDNIFREIFDTALHSISSNFFQKYFINSNPKL